MTAGLSTPGPREADLRSLQAVVDRWVQAHGVRYFSELTNTAVLMEEVGELARIMARRYGDQSFKRQADRGDLADELADVLFVLVCIANPDRGRSDRGAAGQPGEKDAPRPGSAPEQSEVDGKKRIVSFGAFVLRCLAHEDPLPVYGQTPNTKTTPCSPLPPSSSPPLSWRFPAP